MDKNGLQDLGILRQAAFDLQVDSQDLVRVASIVQRIKNWWKAKFNPEFAKKQDKIKSSYDNLKDPMSELLYSLKQLDGAFKSQDPDTVAQLAGQLPEVIARVTKHLSTLSKDLNSADKLVPTSIEEEKPISRLYQGYQKDLKVIDKLKSQLPKELDVPVSNSINQPITNFKWFSRFSVSDVYVSDKVKARIKESLLSQLQKIINPIVAEDIINSGIDDFINIIRSNLFTSNTVLKEYLFPDISKQVSERNIEMVAHVDMGSLQFPAALPIKIDLPHVFFHDQSTRYGENARNKISLFKLENMAIDKEDFKNKNNEKQALDWQDEVLDNERNKPLEDNRENIDIDNVLAFDGVLSNLVKQAIISETLPKTRILITVTNQETPYLLKFAKILVSALRQELNADSSSIHINKEAIEVETDVYGSKEAVDLAVKGVTYHIAEQFSKEFKRNIDTIDFELNASSKFKLASSGDFDRAFRKIDLDAIGIS